MTTVLFTVALGVLLPGSLAGQSLRAVRVAQELPTAQLATVVLDDSAFYENIPKGDIITQAGVEVGARSAQDRVQPPVARQQRDVGQPPGPERPQGVLPPGSWLFNNSALMMRSQAFIYAKAEIPQAGTYYLWVRSHGRQGSSFRVSVGDKQPTTLFGNEPLTWKTGGSVELKQGLIDVVLSRIVLGVNNVGSTFDALVLTRNADFKEADLKALELIDDVVLLKEYAIPRSSAVKFGDVDGDRKTDFFVVTRNYDGHVFNHDGRELWSYENEQEGAGARAGFEAPGLVWDLDRDGFAEVVHYRLTGGKEWLVVSDGRTGAIKFKTAWPTKPMPHEYNNFRLAIAKLSGNYPSNILAFTDSGGTISVTAYTGELKQLWQHVENREKDHLGHYVYAVDLNKDGIDEVVTSPPLVLDAAGRVLWNRFDVFDDNHDHCDSIRFYDLDNDGQLEFLAPHSEAGVVVFRSRDGAVMWRHAAEHSQQLEVGNFLRGMPGPHIAVNARTYGRSGEPGLSAQLHWFDAQGKLLSKWPANPLNGNPDFVKGDWKGDGSEELFWYKFKLTNEGKGVLYLKQDAYHMFDFMGLGSDQVIARGGTTLQVYGYKYTKPKAGLNRDFNYWKKVANHTHY
ncbi:MAG: hypothetical protein ND895_25045 [Pyrinomonadaceae bacterium]|nr:hypothetical protein [Pyrinomonadaceae bacterium]